MVNQFIYLHGFASSPHSAKARYIRDRFAESKINLNVPDLNFGNFSHLTITRQIHQVASIILTDSEQDIEPSLSQAAPVILIGSSLGGLTAAHIAQQYPQVQRLVLLAPAFGFLYHWLTQLGDTQVQLWQQQKYLMVYHYGEERSLPLNYDFITDATQYQEEVLQRPIPTLILHGKNDEVIPIQASRDFVKSRPWVELVELDSDHALANVLAEIWQSIRRFCNLS
ncbi:MAG: esterase [Hapalosiphonaceae cyanobacterium JJU2]|nr:MAG: esterase [Hapalosiphonaceae cyanobacterium JJU2]